MLIKRLMKKLIVAICLMFCLYSYAQESYQGPENTKVEMADKLRSSGKIYIVVAVISTVLLGMTVYVIMLDRRIGKLEKQAGDKGSLS